MPFQRAYKSWENSELKNDINFFRAEVQSLLPKLSVSSLKVDTLTTCLREIVLDEEIGKQNNYWFTKRAFWSETWLGIVFREFKKSLRKLNCLASLNI